MQLRYCQVDSDIGNLFLSVYNKGKGGQGGRDVLLTFDGFCICLMLLFFIRVTSREISSESGSLGNNWNSTV